MTAISLPQMNQPLNKLATTSENHFLVPVFQGMLNGADESLVDARILHSVLQVGRRFATWITERIKEYGFIENQDFALISRNGEIKKDASQNGEAKQRGGDRRTKDYHLSLDMAKELAMIEKSDIGRMVRRYFIQCERIANKMTGRTTTTDERTGLRDAVNAIVSKKAMLYPDAYRLVHQRFNVQHIDELTLEQVGEATEYLHRLLLNGSCEISKNWESLIMCALTCDAAWETVKPTLRKVNLDMTSSMDVFFAALHAVAKLTAASVNFIPREIHKPWLSYEAKNHIVTIPMTQTGEYLVRLNRGVPELAQVAFKPA